MYASRRLRSAQARPRPPDPRLLLACLLPIAVAGCSSIPWKGKAVNETVTTSSGAGPINSAVTKTDFHREVSPDQQYNVHLEVGRIYEAQGGFEAAIAEYQKALDACAHGGLSLVRGKGLGEKQSLAHRRMGAAFDRLGRFAQAEVHYRAALKLHPDDHKVWNDSGYSYYLQGRWIDAERNLKMAAKLDPENPRCQTNLGLALAAEGKTDEALAALSKAGGPAAAHANLGYLLAALGKTEEARKQYQDALKLQPDLAPVRQALATLDHKHQPTPPARQLAATPPPVPLAQQVAAAPPPKSPVQQVAAASGQSRAKSDPEVRRSSFLQWIRHRPTPE